MAKAKTLPELREMIQATNGKTFSVKFLKRTTGEVREMQARTKVTKALKGGEKTYNDLDHAVVTVYDMTKKSYRAIPLESIFYFKCGGVEYVKPAPKGDQKKTSRK